MTPLKLWLAPSGRLHLTRTCSGGSAQRMKRVTRTAKQLKFKWDEEVGAGRDPSLSICRCAQGLVVRSPAT